MDEVGTLAAMKAHQRELWTPTIERFGGRVVGGALDLALGLRMVAKVGDQRLA